MNSKSTFKITNFITPKQSSLLPLSTQITNHNSQMAANLMPVQPPPVVRPSATASGNQKSDDHRRSWWTPLFGWSNEPDYIDSTNTDKTKPDSTTSSATSDPDRKTLRSRKSQANFTDEKARKLRMLTMETESFHDAMYHSAIASRLASDFSDR